MIPSLNVIQLEVNSILNDDSVLSIVYLIRQVDQYSSFSLKHGVLEASIAHWCNTTERRIAMCVSIGAMHLSKVGKVFKLGV